MNAHIWQGMCGAERKIVPKNFKKFGTLKIDQLHIKKLKAEKNRKDKKLSFGKFSNLSLINE